MKANLWSVNQIQMPQVRLALVVNDGHLPKPILPAHDPGDRRPPSPPTRTREQPQTPLAARAQRTSSSGRPSRPLLAASPIWRLAMASAHLDPVPCHGLAAPLAPLAAGIAKASKIHFFFWIWKKTIQKLGACGIRYLVAWRPRMRRTIHSILALDFEWARRENV